MKRNIKIFATILFVLSLIITGITFASVLGEVVTLIICPWMLFSPDFQPIGASSDISALTDCCLIYQAGYVGTLLVSLLVRVFRRIPEDKRKIAVFGAFAVVGTIGYFIVADLNMKGVISL